MRETCTSGTVRGGGGNVPTYSAGDRRLRDAGLGQNRLQTWATIGERGHHGVGGSADRLKASVDQHCDVRIGPRDGPEDLPASLIRLDIADAHLQMTFTVITAADKGRVPR